MAVNETFSIINNDTTEINNPSVVENNKIIENSSFSEVEDFYAINTALLHLAAKNPIKIGELMTGGLGTGGNPLLGEQAAEESKEAITDALEWNDEPTEITGTPAKICKTSAKLKVSPLCDSDYDPLRFHS
ncbi:hypothetical protein MTR_1g054795 [Medicago truncatula]|uniref:Uncharacterized protein n=1 Tax=Medicago truncatula TaxID=3880 RepID=A0A072VJL8_MEDTR|nr:hypothetical protein MTR_1g054795 [Medicago truncatula]